MFAPMRPRPTIPSSDLSVTPAPFDGSRAHPKLPSRAGSLLPRDEMADSRAPITPYSDPADALVIFGITGDLARKMTFRALYRLERRGALDSRIIGIARDRWDDDSLREHARSAVAETVHDFDDATFNRLSERFDYVYGDSDDDA